MPTLTDEKIREIAQKYCVMAFDNDAAAVDLFARAIREALELVEKVGILFPGRIIGKSTFVIERFLEDVKAGKNCIYVGMDYVVMSNKHYDELLRASRVPPPENQITQVNLDTASTIDESGGQREEQMEPKRYSWDEIQRCGDIDMDLIFTDDPALVQMKRDAEALRKLGRIVDEYDRVELFRNESSPTITVMLTDWTDNALPDQKCFSAPSLTEAIEQIKEEV